MTNANDAGPGSLRQAIIDIDTGGTIEFDATFFNALRTIPLTGSDLTITRNMTINGPGPNFLRIIGPGDSRVFRTTATVTLIGLRITGGNIGTSNGGGISNNGNLTVRDCYISENTGAFGGGISNQGAGQLTVINSSIINNTAIDRGGGIDSTGTLTVQNSTISSNITTDTTGQNGGGIWTRQASITNSTITNNAAFGPDSSGGIYRDAGSVTITSSIVAANTNNATMPDVSSLDNAPFNSIGHNIVGNRGNLVFSAIGDQSGTAAARIDPLLAPLSNNGGRTPTHALLANSLALDAGNGSGFQTDQRGSGFARQIDLPLPNAPGGDGADVGSFEAQSDPGILFTVAGRIVSPTGLALRSLTVVMTDSTNSVRTASTSSFGNYTFTGVPAGSYVISVRSKRYRFSPVARVVSGNIDDLNFTGLE